MWRSYVYGLLALCSAPVYADLKNTQSTTSKVTDPVSWGDFSQVFLGLIIVVIAIFAMAWMIKRMGYIQTRTHGQLKVIGGVALGQRERLVLVQVGEQQLLLGIAPGNVSTLHVLEKPIDLDSHSDPNSASFAAKLQSMLQGKSRQ